MKFSAVLKYLKSLRNGIFVGWPSWRGLNYYVACRWGVRGRGDTSYVGEIEKSERKKSQCQRSSEPGITSIHYEVDRAREKELRDIMTEILTDWRENAYAPLVNLANMATSQAYRQLFTLLEQCVGTDVVGDFSFFSSCLKNGLF